MSVIETLEQRIVQLYMWTITVAKCVDGRRTAPMVRLGAYEVRLIEPPSRDDRFPVWTELFDHDRKKSLDSYAGYDFEEAARVAEGLISRARVLSGVSTTRR